MAIRIFHAIFTILFAVSFTIISACSTQSQQSNPNSQDAEISTLDSEKDFYLIILPNGDSLTLSPDYRHETLQGDDSFVGLIESESQNIVIQYDIGGFSGEYVEADQPNTISEHSANEDFVYSIKSSEDNAVISATFRNRGPANFYMSIKDENDPRIEMFIQILRTYETRE